jgi:hypothetical protein
MAIFAEPEKNQIEARQLSRRQQKNCRSSVSYADATAAGSNSPIIR